MKPLRPRNTDDISRISPGQLHPLDEYLTPIQHFLRFFDFRWCLRSGSRRQIEVSLTFFLHFPLHVTLFQTEVQLHIPSQTTPHHLTRQMTRHTQRQSLPKRQQVVRSKLHHLIFLQKTVATGLYGVGVDEGVGGGDAEAGAVGFVVVVVVAAVFLGEDGAVLF